MRALIIFLTASVLFFAFIIPWVSAQIENLPWGVERTRGDLPWDEDRDLIVDFENKAGRGVRIAVIDTGIWRDHPDLRGRVVDGISYGIGEYWEDYDGHGTRIAGTIAAVDDGNHLIGVAPNASLYAVKRGSLDSIIDGINWAVDKGVNMISMSFGFYEDDVTEEYLNSLEEACNNAYNGGVLLIAGSGNDDIPIVVYPAAFDSVIAVGAVDQSDDRWIESYPPGGSNYGWELEFAGPGADINSTFPPNTYNVESGTSYAVPHVTGTAALIFGSKVDPEYDSNSNGQWDSSEVREKLKDTALDLAPPTGKDAYYGYGLVNAWYSNQRPPGDITYDYLVDGRDLSLVTWHWGETPEDPYWFEYARPCDISINNEVDVADLTIIGFHYIEFDP
jgi:subtilisin